MVINARHAQFLTDSSCLLAPGATETGQCISRYIVTALYGNVLNGVGHVGHSDLYETFGHFLGLLPGPDRRLDLDGQCCELLMHDLNVDRLVSLRAENIRKISGLNLT